jgi:hypothetical protein
MSTAAAAAAAVGLGPAAVIMSSALCFYQKVCIRAVAVVVWVNRKERKRGYSMRFKKAAKESRPDQTRPDQTRPE